MKRLLKSMLFFLLYYSGLERVLAKSLTFPAAIVLMYHGIADDSPVPDEIDFNLSRKSFESQLRALASRYKIIRLSELVDRLDRREPLDKAIVITFDDGYENNASIAAPILAANNVPWTLYATTGFIGTHDWLPLNRLYARWAEGLLPLGAVLSSRKKLRATPTSERGGLVETLTIVPTVRNEASFRMLSWQQLQALHRSGVEVGSHTHSHCNLTVESDESAKGELERSKEVLEGALATRIGAFAYPYGCFSDQTKRLVVAVGYSSAVTTEYGAVTAESDRFALPRLGPDKRIWMFTCSILEAFLRHRRGAVAAQPRVTKSLHPGEQV